MKSITFGPVTHKDKPYAYALGYGAYQMGWRRGDNPYNSVESNRNNSEWYGGYDASVTATDAALSKFIQEHS
jgi:hypothetical protein